MHNVQLHRFYDRGHGALDLGKNNNDRRFVLQRIDNRNRSPITYAPFTIHKYVLNTRDDVRTLNYYYYYYYMYIQALHFF